MDVRSYFKIGYIAKTHGLKGEITVMLNNECPSLEGLDSVYVEINALPVPYQIQTFSSRHDKAFIKFEGVDSVTQAVQLKSCSLYLPKDVRPKLSRGEFYDDDVAGFEVEDEKLGLLGTVREVLRMGPNRLLAIGGTREILVPVNGPFIRSISKTRKKIIVDLPDGFLDI